MRRRSHSPGSRVTSSLKSNQRQAERKQPGSLTNISAHVDVSVRSLRELVLPNQSPGHRSLPETTPLSQTDRPSTSIIQQKDRIASSCWCCERRRDKTTNTHTYIYTHTPDSCSCTSVLLFRKAQALFSNSFEEIIRELFRTRRVCPGTLHTSLTQKVTTFAYAYLFIYLIFFPRDFLTPAFVSMTNRLIESIIRGRIGYSHT